MVIIDAHAHIFENLSGTFNGAPLISAGYGKVKNGNKIFQLLPPSFKNSDSMIDVLKNYMDWCNVDKALLTPNVFYGYHNEYVYKSINKYPNMFKGIALVDMLKGRSAAIELNELIVNKGFSGLKIDTSTSFQSMPELMLEDKIFEPIFDCCNELNLPIMFHLFRTIDLNSIKNISDKFKKIKYIICHFGSEAVFGDDIKSGSRVNLLFGLVSSKSNIWIETSSLPDNYGNEDYPYTGSCRLIEKAYKILGPDKIIWGSDYPSVLSRATYKQLINYIIKGCKKIPGDHIEMIMGKNALDIFWPQGI